MPRSSDLPDNLKLLVRRNALELSHNRFNADFGRLVTTIERVLEKADAEREQRAEKERLQPQRSENDENKKSEIQLRQAEIERLEISRRRKEEQERVDAEQREKKRLETERLEKESPDSLRLENEHQQTELPEAKEEKREESEQLGAVKREQPSRGSKSWFEELEKRIAEVPTPLPDEILREEEQAAKGQLEAKQHQKQPVSAVFEPTPSREDGAGSPQPTASSIAPIPSQPKRKWLLAAALALIVVIAGIWFAVYEERAVPLPTDHYQRGLVFESEGNRADAIAEFTATIRSNPDFAAAYYHRSYVYRELGQIDKAENDLATARQLDGK
jgi:tetratricopeptide (TPR) repeat protein